MPWPPPPGPPELGIFQGIGLVPELPTLVGSYFLTNSGGLTVWAPLSGGVLPDMTGHAGQFLTTDGFTASWADVPGGGIDTIGAVTTGQANAAVITGTTLQLSAADATHPGVLTFAEQQVGGEKLFLDGAAVDPYDVRNFGAVPDDPTNDFALAYYAAFAAQLGGSSPVSPNPVYTSVPTHIKIPPGTYYTSVPLVGAGEIPGGADIGGAGQSLTVICPGTGSASTPSLVQGFSGPVMYVETGFSAAQMLDARYQAIFPQFTTALLTGSGGALVLTGNPLDQNTTIRLHDSYPWGSWLGDYATMVTDFALQFQLKVNSPALSVGEYGVLSSRGPDVWFSRAPNPIADIAFGVYVVSDGVNTKLRAYLTTNPDWDITTNMQASGTLYSIDSSNITLATSINVELDYDGAHFDFYVNGVNQGHVAATGPIIRCPWEGVNLGNQGPEIIDVAASIRGIEGSIDSIRLSSAHRHTGTGSFTPPTSKYAWDSSTMALYNWDQGFKTTPFGSDTMTLPFIVGQVKTGTSASPGVAVGPLPHFIRTRGSSDTPDCFLHDFAVVGWRSCVGIIGAYSPRTQFRNLWTIQCGQFGLFMGNSVSFYSWADRIYTFDVVGTGVQCFGDLSNVQSQQCGIAVGIGTGRVQYIDYQPTYTSFAGLVNYGALFPSEVSWFSLDDEVWSFNRQIGGGVNLKDANNVFYHNNFWGTSGGVSPPFLYLGLYADSSITHLNDTFSPGRSAEIEFSAVKWGGQGLPLTNITLDNCQVIDLRSPKLPLSNFPNWISVKTASQANNQWGLSISDTQAKNLAGLLTVNDIYDYGTAIFTRPEPDAYYDVNITPKSHNGATPAAGSNRVVSVSTGTTGFTAFFEAAPGAGSEVTYSYIIVRTNPPAEVDVFEPAIPSSATNPNSGETNLPFGFGVTLVPGTGDCNGWNGTITGPQTVAEAGSSFPGSGTWELSVLQGNIMPHVQLGTFAVDLQARVVNGQYFSLFNPGRNNIVIGYDGANTAPYAYFNGAGPEQLIGAAVNPGVQATPIHIGERGGGAQALTEFTLRHFKFDSVPARCISSDSAIGPGLRPQSLFFGDDITLGFGSSSALGGFATQLAQFRYPTTYYWLGGREFGGSLVGQFGSYIEVFKPWLGQSTAPPLQDACVFPGVNDIVNSGATGADVFDTITLLMDGEKASATFFPPTSFLTPADLRAWAVARVPDPVEFPTANYTLDGNAFSVTYNTSNSQTADDFIAAMVANGTINAAFVGSKILASGIGFVVQVFRRVPGAVGNGYVCTSNGPLWYGDAGGGFGGLATSVLTFAGTDTTCDIAGVTFVATFDTDANTTVNNLIALVMADPTVSALVNVTNVGGTMFTEAATAGWMGNTIRIGGNRTNTPGGINWSEVDHLAGGSNGLLVSGIPGNILLCTSPPIGTISGITPTQVTELGNLNTAILGSAFAGVTVVDVNAYVADPGSPDDLLPVYDGGGGYLNNAGHVAVLNLVAPLLPGVGTAPSAFSYATNPASYASGGAIAANNPTITGSVDKYTVSPPLPTGLSLNPTTGVVTGTPTTPTAAADYKIVAHNEAGSVAVDLNITIT